MTIKAIGKNVIVEAIRDGRGSIKSRDKFFHARVIAVGGSKELDGRLHLLIGDEVLVWHQDAFPIKVGDDKLFVIKDGNDVIGAIIND